MGTCLFSSPEHMLRMSFCDCSPSVVHRPSGVRRPSVRPASGVRRPASGVCSHFQTTSSLKPLACFHPNFIRSISTQGEQKIVKMFLARIIPLVAMATRYQILKNLLLRDRLWNFIFFYIEMFVKELSLKFFERILFR